MFEENPKQIGPYEILDKLGRGGMAVVFKATQTSLNRTVAVKVLSRKLSEDPTSVERFHREAHAVALLNHPNIVQIIDKGVEEGLLYYAMEYVPGDSLQSVLQRRRLSFPEALGVFKKVATGLEYAHQQKIIHRDLNPRNVLVSDDLSVVKLADFGICRVEALSREAGTLSTSEVSMGTLHYLAPEQALDMRRSDHRSDIFSLGVLFYEMLTGTVPVGSFTLPSRLNKEVPPGVDPIVLKCLATDPQDRYDSVGEILADLRKLEESLRLRLVDELKGLSRSTGRILQRSTQSFGPQKRRNAAVALGGLAALTVLAYALVWGPFQGAWEAIRNAAAGNPAPVAQGGEPADSTEQEASVASQSLEAASAGPVSPTPARVQSEKRTVPPPADPTPAPSTSRAADRALESIRGKLQAKDHEAALAETDEFLQSHPGDSKTPDAYLLKAEILHALGRPNEEEAIYREVANRFESRQLEAKYRLADLLRSQRPEGWENQAAGLFETVAAQPNPYVPAALIRLAEIQGSLKLKTQDPELGEVPTSLTTLRRLVKEFPDAPESEYGFWSLANLYRGLDREAEAAAAFEELGRRFPRTHWDAWWEAAQLYDDKIKDKEKAQAAYARVPPSSRNYERAQKRLKSGGQ